MKSWYCAALSLLLVLLLGPETWGQAEKNIGAKGKDLPAKAAVNSNHEKKKAIIAVLQKQEKDWNRGNLEDFMTGYWNSDTLRMVTKTGLTYGFQKAQANFKKNFPDSASMGQLNYEVVHVELIGENDAMVTGKWLLKIDKKFRGGFFTFLFRKKNGRWQIVADHTS